MGYYGVCSQFASPHLDPTSCPWKFYPHHPLSVPQTPTSGLLLLDLLCLELPGIWRSGSFLSIHISAQMPPPQRGLPHLLHGYSLCHHLLCVLPGFSHSLMCETFLANLFLVCLPGWDMSSRRARVLAALVFAGFSGARLCPACRRHSSSC